MGALATPYTAGHTGFTGTSLVIDPTTQAFAILVTNHVHPNRGWGLTNAQRRGVANCDFPRSHPLRPSSGEPTAWYGGMVDKSTATLTLPLTLPKPAQLEFEVWYDTEPESDFLYLESSMDTGKTWRRCRSPKRAAGSRPIRTAPYRATRAGSGCTRRPSAGRSLLLRWRYTTDPLYSRARVFYVDAVRVWVTPSNGFFDDDCRRMRRRSRPMAGPVAATNTLRP